ncbi:MAG: hypothetical protein JXK05_05680 [Campylobacterales bacterium]|nr:hypothetical protein [Campylobacterales bacterium]
MRTLVLLGFLGISVLHAVSLQTDYWPTLHHDMHNSDHLADTLGTVNGISGFEEIAWLVNESEHPSVVMTSIQNFSYDGQEYATFNTGKVSQPNVHVYHLATGAPVWHSTLSSNGGPDACAMTGSSVIDNAGNLYLSDCHYLYHYRMSDPVIDGTKAYHWRVMMPGLRAFNTADGLWYPSTNPTSPEAMAKPFITLFMSHEIAGKRYIGGISVDGGIYMFDPEDGALVASSHLVESAPQGGVEWSDGVCYVDDYVANDDPMSYDMSASLTGLGAYVVQVSGGGDGSGDDSNPFGIWCTGVQPETNIADSDYFISPCQLNAYFAGNTAGSGSLVVNTPSVAQDPSNAGINRIFVVGAQTALLANLDTTSSEEDAILYRVDFEPAKPEAERLTVVNYQSPLNRARFGRMVDGINSATSPTISANEKWVLTGENTGQLYLFSSEDGTVVWKKEIGATLGSPTLVQRSESDGLQYIYAFGNSKIWVFGINPETGAIQNVIWLHFLVQRNDQKS